MNARMLIMGAAMLLTSGQCLADEIKVLSAGAMQRGLVTISAKFKEQTGNQLQIRYATAPQLIKILTENGAAADAILAPNATFTPVATSTSGLAVTLTVDAAKAELEEGVRRYAANQKSLDAMEQTLTHRIKVRDGLEKQLETMKNQINTLAEMTLAMKTLEASVRHTNTMVSDLHEMIASQFVRPDQGGSSRSGGPSSRQ